MFMHNRVLLWFLLQIKIFIEKNPVKNNAFWPFWEITEL